MLRYVTFTDATTVREFCCSRVIFHGVKISVPYRHLLFDNDFITYKFKKYVRREGGSTRIITANCGKCNGYGFYDWVTRLTTDDEEKSTVNIGNLKPVVVKNENPISLIYHYTAAHTYFYVSDFDQSDKLIYRCEQCLGTGMVINKIDRLVPFIPNDEIQQPENKPIIFRRLYT